MLYLFPLILIQIEFFLFKAYDRPVFYISGLLLSYFLVESLAFR